MGAEITGAILKHMIHCEDLVLKGERAFHFGLDALYEEVKRLNGQESSFKITAKWDGAPAIVAASDFHKDKFVALKHSWDKGKVYRSIQEIEDIYKEGRPELSEKLTTLFNKLDEIKIPADQIWMGDFMFSHKDLQVMDIDGEDWITFRPNTLVYAVPNDNSAFAESIRKADIGIVWHTKYTGPDFSNLQISFNVSVDDLNKVDSIFQIDGRLNRVPVSLFTEEEYDRITEMLEDIEDRFNGIISNYKDEYERIISDEKVCQILDRYRNILIRQGKETATYEGLKEHIENLAQADIESKRTERGKKSTAERWEAIKEALVPELLDKIYDLQGWMVAVKEILISKENGLQTIKSFYLTRNSGIIPAAGEGYAVSDPNGNIQKFVSRLGFSAANFSDDVIKGFEHNDIPKKVQEAIEARWTLWDKLLEDEERKLTPAEKSEIVDELVEPLKTATQTIDKKPPKAHIKKNSIEYTIMPDPNLTKVKREVVWTPFYNLMQQADEIFENPEQSIQGTTPVITADIPAADCELEVVFKDYEASKGDAKLTQADEVYWGWCLAMTQNGNVDVNRPGFTLPKEPNDIVKTDLTAIDPTLNGVSLVTKTGYFNGYTAGSELFCREYLDPARKYLVFRVSSGNKPDLVINTFSKNHDYPNIHSMVLEATKKCFGPGFSKDSWNPADLYICAEDFCDKFAVEWPGILEQAGAAEDIKICNDYLYQCIVNKDLIGISLKDCSGTPSLREANTINTTPLCNKEDTHLVQLKLPLCVLESKATKTSTDRINGISWQTVSNPTEDIPKLDCVFSYRIFSGMTTMQMDATPRNGKAHLGKVPKDFLNKFYQEFGLPKEPNFNDSEKIMKDNPESQLPIIQRLEASSLADDPRIIGVKGLTANYQAMVADMQEGRGGSKDLRLYYTWPRILNFVRCIQRAEELGRESEFFSGLIYAAAKELPGCAPYIKIH